MRITSETVIEKQLTLLQQIYPPPSPAEEKPDTIPKSVFSRLANLQTLIQQLQARQPQATDQSLVVPMLARLIGQVKDLNDAIQHNDQLKGNQALYMINLILQAGGQLLPAGLSDLYYSQYIAWNVGEAYDEQVNLWRQENNYPACCRL